MYFRKVLETKTDFWRYVVTLAVVALFYLVIGAIPLALVIVFKVAKGEDIDVEGFTKTPDPTLIGLDQNTGLLLMLIPAVLGFFTLLIFMLKLHGYKPGDIVSAYGKIRWDRVYKGGLIWILLMVAVELVFYSIDPLNYTFRFNAESFLPLLLIALLVLPIQTWSEELLFRSYLMQGIALLTGFRFLALLLTSLGFGLLHSMNPEVQTFGFWSTMPYYVGFGLFAGLLVVFDDGIELAFTIHAVNNIYSALLVSYESSVLTTSAVWHIEQLKIWPMTIGFFVSATLFIIVLRRIFHWDLSDRLAMLFKYCL